MRDVDVVVVGAGPTGLMLAGELGQAGVSTLVLERRSEPSVTAKAGGLAGQVVQLLHYRGELDRFREAGTAPTAPDPAPRFPFGGLHLDFAQIDDPPMRAVLLPQWRLEEVLAERAIDRGADLCRGHEVVAVRQDEERVLIQVRGPDGLYEVASRFLVGCDGARSRVRELAGIPFEGDSLPEVERLASVTLPDSVRVRDDGGLEVRGVGSIPFGYTATERGVFACSGLDGTMNVYTAELDATDYADEPLSVAELSASVRRVLGIDLPLGEPLRMTRFGYSAKQAGTYREGRILLAGDAAHLFPAGGVAINAGMLDAANLGWKLAATIHGWAPPHLLDTYSHERRAAAERTLLHTRAQVALRRGHGPSGDALRALFAELTEDEQPLRRLGALMAGTDIGSPTSVVHALVDTLATDRALGVGHRDRRLAGVMPGSRPVLLDFADRFDLRRLAEPWSDRLDVVGVRVDRRPADALLILPDTRIAWAAALAESIEVASPALRQAASTWLGAPST